jgi:hypothetical protein
MTQTATQNTNAQNTQFAETTFGASKEIPAKIIIYGNPKTGKSRFASEADDAFFLNAEDGLQYLPNKVRATPKLTKYDDVIAWLKHIYENDSFKAGTIVVDSLDWCEHLAQERLVKQYDAISIVDPNVKAFAYHKGVLMAADDAYAIIKWLDAIYKKKGIKAIIIAHSQAKEIDLPGRDPYMRHEMKLSKQLGAKIMEWGDLILFADYSFHVTSDGKTTEPKPVLYAGGSASFLGGGRMALSKELPLSYKELVKHITKG